MSHQEERDCRILDYIDGAGDEATRAVIGRLIASDKDWQTAYRELLGTDRMIGTLELQEPSMRFTLNIMEAVGHTAMARPIRSYVNKWIIRGIAGTLILLLAGLIIYGAMSVNWHAEDSASFIKPSVASRITSIPVVSSGFWTYFIMGNIILGLVLIDSLHRRRRSGGHSGTNAL